MDPLRYPRRGEVYWVELDPAVGAEIRKTRPCLVISADETNRRRKTVVVLPISNGPLQDFPLHVVLTSSAQSSHAVVDQIRSVDKGRLGDLAGMVTASDLSNVSQALRSVLDLG